MYRINQVKCPYKDRSETELSELIAKELRVSPSLIKNVTIKRMSIDARYKPNIYAIYALDFDISDKKLAKKLIDRKKIVPVKDVCYKMPSSSYILEQRPVIIGAGPAGLFCAYILAKAGVKPILIERGDDVDARQKKLDEFFKTGILDPSSNAQFGEGGAGTFSDGKLNTQVKDPFGLSAAVLRIFADHGAPEDITYLAKPHIGTDILSVVVKNIRKSIIRMGGTVCFRTCMTSLLTKNGAITGVQTDRDDLFEDGIIKTDRVVLAIGHSARDTFYELYKERIPMEAKSFAVGVRVEHPQDMIDLSQYGETTIKMPAASYKLTHTCTNGRGVYSFCMCPGGFVVNASSEKERLAVNGMSYHARNSGNANSAMIVTVTPEDFGGESPLAGIEFQRRLEEKAYRAGSGQIPQQLYGDFKSHKITEAYGSFESCTKGTHTFADLHEVLPEFICESLIEGIDSAGRKIKGFDRDDAILSAVESRTSSPVRIVRDEMGESSVKGLFPCGEGAGYAGGITSAAMDGIRTADKILRRI